MHLPLPSIPSVPAEPKKKDPQNAGDDKTGSRTSVESPQYTVVADSDQAAPIKVHETELLMKELESIRSLVVSLHHVQLTMRQENLDTRELLIQRMSAITEDVQAIKSKQAAMAPSSGMEPCALKAEKTNERHDACDARADLVSNYLRGMDEASRVSSPISYRGDCRTANTFDALQPVVLGHAMDSLSKMTSPFLEHCMASDLLFGDAWPLIKPAARFKTESFQERQVRFHNDTQGRAAQDSLKSVAYGYPSLTETSGAPDGISAGVSKPQLNIGVPPLSPQCDHFDSPQDQIHSLRSRSPPQSSCPPSSLRSPPSSPSIPAAPFCSWSVRSTPPGVNDMPDCRKPFLLRPIPRNPSRGRAPTRGGSIANTRSRSRSRHSAKQRSPGVTFYRPKALPSTNQGTGSDVMPQLLSAALAAQRSQCGGAVCIGPPPVSDRCYSRSRSTSRSRSGESYRMRMRNLYPVGSPDRSSRMGSVITKNTQTDAGLHLFSPRSCRTQSPAHRGHSPRFVRARSSSRGSSRRSVSSCGARLLPVDHLRTPLNASLRSASVPTRRSLIESSSLITRRSLTPSTFRSASPTADSPMTPPRMGLSSYPLNPPGSEHGQQCSPGLSLDGGESPRRVFDSPLGLDPISLLAPTYNQIDISPSRMPRASFPSKQTGPLDNVSFPLDGPATISKNSLGLLPSGEEDPLRHSDSAMRGLFTRMQSQINDLTKEVSDLRNTHRRSTPSTASVSGSTIGIIPPTPYIAPFPTLPPPVATLEIPHPPPIQSTSPIPPPPPPVSYGGFSYSGAPLQPSTTTPAQPHPAASFDRSVPFSGRALKLGADAPPITASIGGPAPTSTFGPIIPSDPNVIYSNLPTSIPHFKPAYAPLDLNRPDPSVRSRHLPSSRYFGHNFDSPRIPYAPNTFHPRFSTSGLNMPQMTPDLLPPWFPTLPSTGPPVVGTFEPFRHYGQPMMYPDIHPTPTSLRRPVN